MLPADIAPVLLAEPKARTVTQTKELADYYAKTDKKLAELTKAVADHQKKAPKLSVAPTLAQGRQRKTHILLRGDFLRPGAEGQPGTPAARPRLKTTDTGSRLDLARRIVEPS